MTESVHGDDAETAMQDIPAAGLAHAQSSKAMFTAKQKVMLVAALAGLCVAVFLISLAGRFIANGEVQARAAVIRKLNAGVVDPFHRLDTTMATISDFFSATITDNQTKKTRGAGAISPDMFSAMVRPILDEYPFLQAAVFMPKVSDIKAARFEGAAHAEGLASYRPEFIRPEATGSSTIFFPIRYVEHAPAIGDSAKDAYYRLIDEDVSAGDAMLDAIALAIEGGGTIGSNLIVEGDLAGFGKLQGGAERVRSSLTDGQSHVFWILRTIVRNNAKPVSEEGIDPNDVLGIIAFKATADEFIKELELPAGATTVLRAQVDGRGFDPVTIARAGSAQAQAGFIPRIIGLGSKTHSIAAPLDGIALFVDTTFALPAWDSRYLLLPLSLVAGFLTYLVLAMTGQRMRQKEIALERDNALIKARLERQTKELAENEARFQHLVESTNVVPWAADLSTRAFTYVGPQIENLAGYPVETWYTQGFWVHHVHPEDRERVLYSLDELAECGFAVREYRLRRADGTNMWVRSAVTSAELPGDRTNEGGVPQKIQGFLIDISDEKRAETALLVAKQAAELANRTKSDFLANMSHELRTPMNSIIGFSEMMKGNLFGSLGNDKYQDYVESIYSSGHHLLGLINDILDLSKIEAGKFEMTDEEIDLLQLLKSCHTVLHEQAKRQGINLKIRAELGLPKLYGDERRIKQILLNLLTNSIKFTPVGGYVTLEANVVPGRGLRLAIIDTGIGMEADDLPRALEKFSQIDSSLARQHEGSGLGLPIAKSLAELHGGRLTLESKFGHGTTVTVWLPENRLLKPAIAIDVEEAAPAA